MNHVSVNVNESVCNYDLGSFINDYMRIPSTSDSECNEACKIGEHLDIKNCSCEKILFHKLV